MSQKTQELITEFDGDDFRPVMKIIKAFAEIEKVILKELNECRQVTEQKL